MTEKRFTDVEVDKYYGLICMNHDGRFHSYSEQSLEDLLNTLHEENIYLREVLDIGETNAKSILDVLNIQQKTMQIYRKWIIKEHGQDTVDKIDKELEK